MTVSLKKSVPFVVKAIPEVKIEGKWLSEQIDKTLLSLHSLGFHVYAVISDNHSTNVNAFQKLVAKYENGDCVNSIWHPSNKHNKIYFFYDSVHLVKNVRNNLLNSKRFIFPSFDFNKFYDGIHVPSGEIS